MLGFFRKAIDAFEDAAGGDGDVTRPYIEVVVAVHDTECPDDLVVIQEGFSLTHDHDVADTGVEVFLHIGDLLHELGGVQVASEALSACGAKRTGHRAADLR